MLGCFIVVGADDGRRATADSQAEGGIEMANDMEPDELSLEDLLGISPEDFDAWAKSRWLRIDNPWVLDLIRVLHPHERGLRRTIVCDIVRNNRRRRGHAMPDRVEETIQSAFQRHCVHSQVFRKTKTPSEEGIFHWPNGAGAGVWAVYRDKALSWLQVRRIRL